ncbi:hypothetical protein AMIS_50630 [Actinoplanes missouriensis 431]|uniref:Uncharacterized protein n=1 Tax=Actinoplanes missouriensis (strain ATCC 14538 / DSM 43046 / CBS 188.64 / JCM 3121 / NBRC 102363 / NCIMB 12654 / NRRL B-3342 / UNCC 431) TaxID=512565 RepID=I0HB96_ACTM4|nr:nucleotide disphospho-sugar-binding domain-containing protein [Actinoplanes missouriensis]BAL90283.1 hypothetical protein AMIS_50630 [Actinoplanes missouriensis 431]
MRVLFLTGGSPATVFAVAPLAAATRLAGHDVLVAAPADMTPMVTGVGLPAVAITGGAMLDFMFIDRSGRRLTLPADPAERVVFNGHGFGRLAAASLPALEELAASWRPDLVVGGSLCYAAGLLAAKLGVPYVRHTWDLGEPPEMDRGAAAELATELAALGRTELSVPDLWVDICPPALRAPGLPGPRQNMRFTPVNLQRPLEPWMYRAARRRVCVTLGSRVTGADEIAHLTELITMVGSLDVEIVVAAPEPVAAALREGGVPAAHAGWLPLDVILPTCRVLVHHGGGQSALNALRAGVAQLLLPDIPKMVEPCERIARHGSAVVLVGEEQSAGRITAAVADLVSADSYTRRARDVRAEMAAQPAAAEVVGVLERLVR